MKSQNYSTGVNPFRNVQVAGTRHIRSKSPLQQLKVTLGQWEKIEHNNHSHHETYKHQQFEPIEGIFERRVRNPRGSDPASIYPPVSHTRKLEQSVSTGIVRDVDIRKQRLKLDNSPKAMGIPTYQANNLHSLDTLQVPSQSQLNKLFRIKIDAAKLMQQLSISQAHIDNLNTITSQKQLVEHLVRVFDSLYGQSVIPGQINRSSSQSSQLIFTKANNELLATTLTKTKQNLQKTRKDWSEVCDKLTDKQLQLQKLQQQLFKYQRLYQEEKIKRHSQSRSQKDYSVTLKQMKICLDMNSQEKQQLVRVIEQKNLIVERLTCQKSALQANLSRLKLETDQLKQKFLWVNDCKESIAKFYEEYLLLLANNRQKYSKVFRDFEEFIKNAETVKVAPPQVNARLFSHEHIPLITSTSIQADTMSNRPRSTEFNNHPQIHSFRPISVHNAKQMPVFHPITMVQQQVLKIEQKYRSKLEIVAAENMQLKDQLSKITDRCLESGMLKNLLEESKSSKAVKKEVTTPKIVKFDIMKSPRHKSTKSEITESFKKKD